MSKEYAIYPFRYMNITQRHDQGNHIPHWQGSTNYSDKPWDEACKDSGRSYFEPQNDFVIEQVLGLNGDNTTNSVRLKSVNKLYIPYKSEPDYLYITLTHMNEDNLKQVYKGQVLKKGSKILLEGTDGYATGNHFHITANLGKYYGLLKNSNGSWCYTYDKSLLPNEAFYVDTDYTILINTAGYKFQNLPKEEPIYIGSPVERNENVNQIEVVASQLNCRKEAGLNGEFIGFVNKGIYNYTDTKTVDGYTWYNIGIGWIAYHESWENLYPKKEEEIEQPVEPSKEPDAEQKEESDINSQETSKNEENGQKKGKITDMLKNIIKTVIEWIKKLFKR